MINLTFPPNSALPVVTKLPVEGVRITLPRHSGAKLSARFPQFLFFCFFSLWYQIQTNSLRFSPLIFFYLSLPIKDFDGLSPVWSLWWWTHRKWCRFHFRLCSCCVVMHVFFPSSCLFFFPFLSGMGFALLSCRHPIEFPLIKPEFHMCKMSAVFPESSRAYKEGKLIILWVYKTGKIYI